MKTALTDMGVQKLKPGIYYDEKLPAFGIRIGKTTRTWIIQKGQRPRRTVTLGRYPSVTLQEARRRAHAAFSASHIDLASIAFPKAVEEFLAIDRWRPKSKAVLTSNLKHFKWTKAISKITTADVLVELDNIKGDSARWHAKKDITTFFNWCVPRYIATSPTVGIKSAKQPTRDRVLTDDELKAVWIAAEQMGHFGVIVKLLILTGQRRSEIGSLKWEYLKDDRLVFPASATKNGREHGIPTNATTTALIASASTKSPKAGQMTDQPLAVFGNFSAWSKSHVALLKLSGTSGWTLHDLRRTFATNLAALGVRQEVTEKILNHVSGQVSGVAAIYNRHNYASEMRAAMELWETHLLMIVEG